ncbi:hypothetical protein MKZ38_009589 [Zalerion maritima]|uniref:Dienelactone hydrolase domain-containing protein n=1 Tax=Zalerion maritima TaxID=339359 RepID=A0AAD5RUL5_9PEZI|nr:hypothetical protein MKZ38_009589 [Zalerion maritima]
MASNPPGHCCTLGHLHSGDPKGKMIKIGGGKIDAYLATPPEGKAKKDTGILFCPDVIGIWQNSKLMADLYAEHGYLTLIVDEFNGDPLSLNRPKGFDMFKWLKEGSTGDNPHTAEKVDPIILAGIKAMKEDYGIKKLGGVGYCFGAKYVVRHYKNGIDAGYAAHPSFVEEDELAAITGPLSIAAAETDSIFPSEKRHKSEEILKDTGMPYQINLYSSVAHGFSVRGNMENKVEKWAKEQAFLQAISWFDWHLVLVPCKPFHCWHHPHPELDNYIHTTPNSEFGIIEMVSICRELLNIVPGLLLAWSSALVLQSPHWKAFAVVVLHLSAIAFSVLAVARWIRNKYATPTAHTDIYSLAHARLNIKMPPETMWMNMGYWEKTNDFPAACEALLLEVLKDAGLLSTDSVPGALLPSQLFSNNDSLYSGLSVLDLGFGCGDQSLFLDKIFGGDSSASHRAETPQLDFNYVGLTLNKSQHAHAESRAVELEAFQRGHLRLFQEDAAKPETWGRGTVNSIRNLVGDTPDPSQPKTRDATRKKQTQTWILALDTLYHFAPCRLPIFKYSRQALDASVMAFDLILSPDISFKSRCILKIVAMMAGCPADAFKTEKDYRDTLVRAGYKAEDVHLRDVTERDGAIEVSGENI